MPSSYTTSLRLTLPATGELAGQWGTTVNTGITELLDSAVAGTTSISTWGGAGVAYTLSNNSGTGDEARRMFIVATGTPGEAKNVICPAVSKFYVFRNDTTGGFALTLKTPSGTGISVPAGQYKFLYCDGTNVVETFNSAGALTLSGALSVGGTTTLASNPTLSAGTANQVQYLNASKVLVGSANLTFDGTSLTLGGNPTVSAGTANGVTYLNGSKVLTSGSALTFDGNNMTQSGASAAVSLLVNTSNAGVSASNYSEIQLADAGSVRTYWRNLRDGSGATIFSGNDHIRYALAGTEQMRLTSTGLGIGTSNPQTKLHVSGTGSQEIRISTLTSGSPRLALNAEGSNGGGITYDRATSLLQFDNGGTTALYLNISGNLGLGVTPSAWGAPYTGAFQMKNGGSLSNNQANDLHLSNNTYHNGTNWIYTSTNPASRFEQFNGGHFWFTAPSGTAGNAITGANAFVQAMTLDASARWQLNTTTFVGNEQAIIQFNSSGTVTQALNTRDSNASANGNAHIVLRRSDDTYLGSLGRSSTDTAMFVEGNSYLALRTGGTERARITSGGDFGLGTTSPSSLGGSITTMDVSGAAGGGIRLQRTSSTTTNAYLVALSGEARLATADSNPLTFYTNNTERARITSGGDLLVGTTAATAKVSTATSGNGYNFFAENTNTASTSNYLYWGYANAASRFIVYGNGGIANYQANDANLSDRREKTNFAPAKSYLDTICAIPVQTFNYIDQSEDDPGLTLGVVAQDVQAVAPELVMESNWGTEDNPKMRLSIYQTDLQYALMKCVQELKAELDSVKAELATLKGQP
jgi:hypothetical protein